MIAERPNSRVETTEDQEGRKIEEENFKKEWDDLTTNFQREIAQLTNQVQSDIVAANTEARNMLAFVSSQREMLPTVTKTSVENIWSSVQSTLQSRPGELPTSGALESSVNQELNNLRQGTSQENRDAEMYLRDNVIPLIRSLYALEGMSKKGPERIVALTNRFREQQAELQKRMFALYPGSNSDESA